MDTDTLRGSIEAIYREADEHTARFSERSLRKCPTVCGRCCESPFIEASALECLPLAHSLLPKAELWEESLELFLRRNKTLPSPCPFYVTFGFGKGFCSVYEHRPLICRLFGFAAFRDEAGLEQFDTCHYHKEKGSPAPPVDPDGTGRFKAPFYKDYGRRVAALAPELSQPVGIARAVYEALKFLRGN